MLFNVTKNKKVIDKIRIADTFFSRFKGLMFEAQKNFDYALIFEMNKESRIMSSIHMLFVFFPIDVIFLDSQKRVVEVKEKLLPFTISFTPKKPTKYIIEMPVGKSKDINVNDLLAWP